jgi:adenosylhomocysteine nucleosidase
LIAFITGLTAEARLLSALPVQAYAGGGTPEGAALAAEAAIAAGASALVSFGLAGGLKPALRPGAILRPIGVIWKNRHFQADPRLVAALGSATQGLLLAAESTIAWAQDKQAAFKEMGAVAVDLESGAVAEVAGRHGVRFAMLRAVCDTAEENLPPAALAALDPAGKIKFLRVAHSVVRHPEQIPALLALAANANAARKTLAKEVAALSARGALQPWL